MNIIEIFAVITGVISVYLTIKQNIFCWVFGLISSALLLIYFNNKMYYGQMSLQVVSIIQCVIGFIMWNKIDNKLVKKTNKYYIIGSALLIGVFGALFAKMIHMENVDIFKYMDGIGGFIALLATYLLIVKRIEGWWLFMINNLVVVVICLNGGDYYIALLDTLLFVMSIKGYNEWNKHLITI